VCKNACAHRFIVKNITLRYPLLLGAIGACTPAGHEDERNLHTALRSVQAVVATINELQRETERICAVRDELRDPPCLLHRDRRIVCDTTALADTGRTLRIVVFNDAVLVAKVPTDAERKLKVLHWIAAARLRVLRDEGDEQRLLVSDVHERTAAQWQRVRFASKAQCNTLYAAMRSLHTA